MPDPLSVSMAAPELLSPRELQVAQDYASGETYQSIAERLRIAPSTVRTHLATIYRKLEVSSKLELHARLEGGGPMPRDQSDMNAVISELALSLEEALSREKALAEVLRIIGTSHGDPDTVIQAILHHALELCDAEFGVLLEYHGAARFRAAHSRAIPEPFRAWFDGKGVFEVGPRTGLGRMAASHEVVNILDVRSEEVYRTGDPLRIATAELGGARSFLAIPMVMGDQLRGAFAIYRQRLRPFTDTTTGLARMFADQSVIALENARLVSALRAAGGGE